MLTNNHRIMEAQSFIGIPALALNQSSIHPQGRGGNFTHKHQKH